MDSFDTDRFIFEIENKPCLWDQRQSVFKDKFASRRAIEELCHMFIPGFEAMDVKTKNKNGKFILNMIYIINLEHYYTRNTLNQEILFKKILCHHSAAFLC